MNGKTSPGGLYAIGEVACTGLHGANRLASNSLLEGVVMADRAWSFMLRDRPPAKRRCSSPMRCPIGKAARRRMSMSWWSSITTGTKSAASCGITSALSAPTNVSNAPPPGCRNLQREVQEFYWNFRVTTDLLELRNLVTVAALIVDSAVSRKESRGLHYTLDYPDMDDSRFLKDSLIWRT